MKSFQPMLIMLLNPYKKLQETIIQEITISYKREIINNKIIIYEYQNIADSLNKILSKTEKDIESGLIK